MPTGVQYAMQPFRGGFLVTDGHDNRVLWAGRDGSVRELIAFDNIVPTGLEVLVAAGLDRPTSMEVVGTTAYVVTIDGEIWRVDGVSGPPHRG